MKIEILFYDVADLYGEQFNALYLSKCVKDAEIIYTSINEKPHFVSEKVAFIYMGPMKEKYQEVVIEKLRPYKDKIKELIEDGQLFLITGNALEIFGQKIDDIEGLGIFDYQSKRDFSYHHASAFMGEFEGKKVVGFKSQFSNTYGNKDKFIKVINGYGLLDDDNNEGIRYHNFFGTYLIGPILILNPCLCEFILNIMTIEYKLAYNDTIYQAYQKRIESFEKKESFKR